MPSSERSVIEPANKPKAEYREWDPRYPQVVDALLRDLRPLPAYLEIEHIGSTAIQGCGGKGVIDLLGLYSEGRLVETKAYLLGIGFGRQGPEFARPWPEERPMYLGNYRWANEPFLIYLHVVCHNSPEIARFRLFLDRLRQNPDLVGEYSAQKHAIIAEGVDDTDEYRIRKRRIIHKILAAQ